MSKKHMVKKIAEWLKDAGLKALAIFLLLAAGFYAYAQITWPGADPNPTTGVVGVFVGESETAFATPIDYDQANQKCATSTDVNVAGSHVCTPDEMINSYNHGVVGISPIYKYLDSGGSTTLWINSGPPGFTANANDCKGWTATTSPGTNPNYGTLWNFNRKYGGLLPCRTGKKFACCK